MLSHIRIGLEIKPPDPDLSKLKAEIESLAKVNTSTVLVERFPEADRQEGGKPRKTIEALNAGLAAEPGP